MSATAAYQTTVKVGGTPTAITDEAMQTTNRYTYQITDTAKRALDPDTAITVKRDGSAVSSTEYVVRYPSGCVDFLAQQNEGVVITMTGAFLPLLSVAEARAVDVTVGYETADVSRFGDVAARKLITRQMLSGSLENWHLLNEDIDPGSGTFSFGGALDDACVFLEVIPGGATTTKLRGWVRLTNAGQKIALADAVNTTVDFEGVLKVCANTSQTLWEFWNI